MIKKDLNSIEIGSSVFNALDSGDYLVVDGWSRSRDKSRIYIDDVIINDASTKTELLLNVSLFVVSVSHSTSSFENKSIGEFIFDVVMNDALRDKLRENDLKLVSVSHLSTSNKSQNLENTENNYYSSIHSFNFTVESIKQEVN